MAVHTDCGLAADLLVLLHLLFGQILIVEPAMSSLTAYVGNNRSPILGRLESRDLRQTEH